MSEREDIPVLSVGEVVCTWKAVHSTVGGAWTSQKKNVVMLGRSAPRRGGISGKRGEIFVGKGAGNVSRAGGGTKAEKTCSYEGGQGGSGARIISGTRGETARDCLGRDNSRHSSELYGKVLLRGWSP